MARPSGQTSSSSTTSSSGSESSQDGSSTSSSSSSSSSGSGSGSGNSSDSSSSGSGTSSSGPVASPPPRSKATSRHDRGDDEPVAKRPRRSPSQDYRSRDVGRDRDPVSRSRGMRDNPDRTNGRMHTGARPREQDYRSQRSFRRDDREPYQRRSPPQGRRQEPRQNHRQRVRELDRSMSFDRTDVYLKRRAQERDRQNSGWDRIGSDQDDKPRRAEEHSKPSRERDRGRDAGNEPAHPRHRRQQESPPRRPEAARPDNGQRSRSKGWGPQSGKEEWGKEGNRPQPAQDVKEVKPDFGLSGALADETNKVNGVTLVYQEPPEAAQTNKRWRLYTFKAGELQGEPLYLHRQSCYLFGRERRVVDIPTDHPSCSKQHAVFQYRRTSKVGEDGMPQEAVRPYLMDLGSTNGTFINNERLDAQRFYEVLEKDVMKMGHSSREYVLLHEGSMND